MSTVPMPAVLPAPARPLAGAIAARLLTITHAPGYYGRVGRLLPGAPDSTPLDPPTKTDGSGRVQPYYILTVSPGAAGAEPDLADTYVERVHTVQVTVAGGDLDDVLDLADVVHGLLHRWAPTVDGYVCGPLRPPPGYDPGPPFPDDAIAPPRLFTPLQYQLGTTPGPGAATTP